MVQDLLAIPGVDINSSDSIGRTTFWWAQKQGHIDIANCLADHAYHTGTGIPPMELALGPQARFDTDGAYCDVCVASISEDYYYCKSCSLGDFCICLECRDLGAHCIVGSHDLFRYRKDG